MRAGPSRPRVRDLVREVAAGKTIGRVLTNRVLAGWRDDIKGVVLDLAAGASPSYRRVLGDEGKPALWITVDIEPANRPTVVADVTHQLPFRGQVADAVVLCGFLYIAPRPDSLLVGIRRVLKPNGRLILTAPLVFAHNPEPTDFWRFTSEALALLLKDAGFEEFEIVPVGGRWTAAAYLLGPYLRPRWLVAPAVYLLCVWLDAFFARFLGRRLAPCPIGYCIRAKRG